MFLEFQDGPSLGLEQRAVEGEARGSVDEPLAGLLPAAGRAPHVPVLHPVHLAALFAFSSGLP